MVPSRSGRFLKTYPADTRDVMAAFHATSDDVNEPLPRRAKRMTAGSHPAPRRAEILFRLGEILIRNKDAFAVRI